MNQKKNTILTHNIKFSFSYKYWFNKVYLLQNLNNVSFKSYQFQVTYLCFKATYLGHIWAKFNDLVQFLELDVQFKNVLIFCFWNQEL